MAMEEEPPPRVQRRTTWLAQGNCVDQCLYDTAVESKPSVVPRQAVFTARPSSVALAQETQTAPAPTFASSFATPSDFSDQASRVQSVAAVSSAQWLWHGSSGADRYVEPFNGEVIVVPKEVVRGEDDTILHWGRSHMSNFMPFITESTRRLLKSGDDDVAVLSEIDRESHPKDLYHVYAAAYSGAPELVALLPPRQLSDKLISLYLNSFESYFRVLHAPTFLESYANFWSDPSAAVGSMAAIVLAVCAISSCLDSDAQTSPAEWVAAVRTWLHQQDAKTQLTLGYLQSSLLTLIASEMTWSHIELNWVAAGTLVRNAVAAGLHREPSGFIRVSPFYAEIRRRLWYSIVEFDLAVSSKEGRLPSVHEGDFDCAVPSNVNDDMLTEAMDRAPTPTTASKMTQSTCQICLAESWTLRNRLCRIINAINVTASYEDVLKLDAQMKAVLRDASTKLAEENNGLTRSLFMILVCRPLFAARRYFATRAPHDPRYLYSRQACLDTAIFVLTDALSPQRPGHSSHFRHLVNICRNEIAGSTFVICQELLAHAAEQTRNEPTNWSPLGARDHPQRKLLLDLAGSATAELIAVAKDNAVNQRMCSWLQLCVALSEAATDREHPPAVAKDKVREIIRTYHDSIRNGQTKSLQCADSITVDIPVPTDLGLMDGDYFNLFSDLNNMETISEWMLLSDIYPESLDK